MTRLIIALALAVSFLAAPALAQDAGHDGFTANCAACHQPTGLGVKGAFPALAGDAFVQGDAAALANRVLRGKGGMPAFGDALDDAEIAQILTYIRSAWGNSAGPVTADQVATARSGASAPPPPTLQAH